MNKWRSFGRWICASACVAIFAAVAFSQTDNTQISGFVKDPAGAVVANAKVVVKNETREFERTTTTNSDGYYIVTPLPPGLYSVTVEAQGFKTYKESGKKLDANIPATADVSLTTGQVSETVNVTAQTNQVQTESASMGKVVEGSQIQYIQLNGRNPLFLSLLKPGVNSGSAIGGFSFSLSTGGLNINGSRTQDNLITMDGAVSVRTRSNGTSIGVADADSTQEVQILTANYNAEYGRSAGGQVRIVTKSGTRDLHGTFYEFIRNSFFNANSHTRNRTVLGDCGVNPKLDNCRPSPFRYNQYGYNVNGPIYIPGLGFNKDRNKLFFLWGQEWAKQRQTSTTLTSVPTVKMRNGDFSELLVANNPFYGSAKVITDPLTGLPYAGNIIPKAGSAGCGVTVTCTSVNGLALLNAYPVPTTGLQSGTANFTQSRPTTDDQRKDTISIDYYPTEKHQFRWRAQLFHYVGVSAFRANTDRAPQIIDRPNQTTSLNWVWTMSPNWVNEFLAAASRDQVFIYVDQSSGAYKRSIYGITYPYIFSDPKEIQDKIPTINFGSVFTDLDGGPYPSSSKGPIYQLSDNVTNIRGAHTLKAGFLFERAGENDFDQINVSGVPGGTNNQNGRFEFRNGVGGTGLDIANAAIGRFSNYAEIGNRSYTPYRGHMYEWFFQDSWKVNSKLRIEAGIRHSIIQPFYSLWRNMAVFDPATYNPAIAAVVNPTTGFITSGSLASLYNGIIIPGDGFPDSAKGPGRVAAANSSTYNFLFRGASKEYSNIHKKDFQPRVGIAYAINDKTVFRAGAGRFMTRVGVSDSVFLGGNAPFQPMVSIANGSVDNPGGGSNNAFTQNITTQDKNFRNPETYTWNATFEREIFKNTTLEIAYVGKRGLHAQRERNLNQLAVGTTFLAANAGVKPDALRPYKGFNSIRVTENVSNSKYNALQINLNRRFTNGLGFGFAYTLSKSLDSGSQQRDILPNAFDWTNIWGPSDFDRRHVAVVNFIYKLPFFKDTNKMSGKLLGGWTLSGVSQMQTGTPFSIATGDDFAGVGPGSGSQFWIINGNPQLENGNKRFATSSADQSFWFATKNGDTSSIFVAPANGTISTQFARNILYAPGFQNHNVGLLKDFNITEHHALQFRMEAFNFLNHPNWSGPDTNPRSATFGKILSKNSERNLQFALRYSF